MAQYADDYTTGAAPGEYYYHQQQQQQQSQSNGPVSITRDLRPNRLQQQHHHQQQQQHDDYYDDGRYGYAEDQAHDILDGRDSPQGGSDDEVAEQLQIRNGQQQQGRYQYDDGMQGEQGLDHGEGEEEDIEDDSGSFSDSLSSSPSIPDEDIDFNLVYALHTFLATVDGQASVVKGDKLLLLDDSNSYWWLVRVLKTQAIGYIPAENIETPWERLARLNKHRNVDLTSATQQDMVTGPTSTTAQTRFVNRVPPSQQPHPHESRHPYSKGIPASPSHKDHPRNISPMAEPRPGSSKAKIVLFTTPTYYAHSASGMTDEEYDGEEGGEVEYEEEGMEVDEHEQHEQGGGFEEDEDEEEDEEIDAGHQAGGEESEFSDEEDREGEAALAGGNLHDEMSSTGHGGGVEDEAAKREHWERETAAAMQAQQQAAEAEAQWARDREEQQQQQQRDLEQQQQQQRSLSPSHSITSATGRGALSPQNLNAQQPDLSSSVPPPSGKRSPSSRFVEDTNTTNTSSAPYSPTTTRQLRSPTSGGSLNGRSTFDENAFASAPTKKLTATPPIARGSEGRFDDPEDLAGRFDAFAADAEAEAAPYDLSPQRQQQKQLYASPQQQQQQQLRDDLSAPTLSPTSSAQGLGLVQKVRGIDLVDPRDPRYHRMLQPTKQAGEEGVYERIVMQQRQEQQQQSVAMVNKRSFSEDGTAGVGETSIGSIETGDSRGSDGGSLSSSTGRRASQTTGGGAGGAGAKDDGSKKRKSGGGILGLFRKKDKKKKGGAAGGEKQTEDEPRSSEDSGRLVSPTATGSSLSGSIGGAGGRSPRSSADRGPSSGGALSSSKRDSTQATAESMFSTDAALRQQELEAKQALYQQYGVQRNPGDLSNTMTPRVVSNGSSIDVQLSQQQYQQQQQQQRSNNRNSLQLLNHPSSLVGPHGSPGSMSGSLAPLQRQRPGSLMGTPSLAGIEVPLLSVMRVFAGEHVDSEATFKTVLLNQSTTSTDLVKQAMQRFRLVEAELTTEDFFLTVKEIGGEERALEDDEKPLGVFEDLSERAGDDVLPPNVRRSSIGSINSISSALSINPAITRLGMNDWSDDSAVKFYLNRRGMDPSSPAFDPAQQYQGEEEHTLTPTLQQGEYSDNGSNYTATPTLDHGAAQFGSTSSPGQSPIAHPSATLHPAPALLSSSSSASSSGPAPSYRFAIRLLIHPSDLPDTVVFDPHSTAIIPKAVLLERQQRSGGFSDASGDVSPNAREKIIFFPRNANVSEVVEAALDRFGIVDGVVDGGDEVEDRVSRRRSVTRVKYSLAAEKDGRELLLNASGKLLEAFSSPPLFKAYDRNSKEFRRRSVDATLVLGTPQDVQPSDPVFILRRSAVRAAAGVATRGPLPQTIDELEERQQQRREDEQEVLAGSPNSNANSNSPTLTHQTSSSQRDLIAAQRAAQRANQRAILSAQGNSDQGVDIKIPEQGTIRSARGGEGDAVRYSFINNDGTEVDISEIVENEWSGSSAPSSAVSANDTQHFTNLPPPTSRPPPRFERSASAATNATDYTESFRTAREVPSGTEDEDEDEQEAIDALRTADLDVGQRERTQSPSSSSSLTPQTTLADPSVSADVLQGALGPRPVTSPVFNESLQERLDRVLVRVKEEKARRAASPAGGRPRSYISGQSGSATPSGRLSPAMVLAGLGNSNGRASPSANRSPSSMSGRLSPYLGNVDTSRGRDSPSIDQILKNQSPRSISSATFPPRNADDTAPTTSSSRHVKQSSAASLSSLSGASSSNATDQPLTPITNGSGSAAVAFTPASSAASNHPLGGQQQQPPLTAAPPQIVYRDDFGYETLAAIVEDAAYPRGGRSASRRTLSRGDEALEGLFGREVGEEVHPAVKEVYEAPSKVFADLDARLDALLLELTA